MEKIKLLPWVGSAYIQYSFGIILWTENEIRNIDTKTRTLMSMHGFPYPKSDVKRKKGGRF